MKSHFKVLTTYHNIMFKRLGILVNEKTQLAKLIPIITQIKMSRQSLKVFFFELRKAKIICNLSEK